MTKPIELAVHEFNQSLIKLVNESNLPAFIIAQSLQGVMYEVNKIAEDNLQKAKEQYESEVTDNG